jgi:hypothetical protein
MDTKVKAGDQKKATSAIRIKKHLKNGMRENDALFKELAEL